MVSKVRNFWLCVFSGVVATTLITMWLMAMGGLQTRENKLHWQNEKNFGQPAQIANTSVKQSAFILLSVRFEIFKKINN